jgi:hypothetical protein
VGRVVIEFDDDMLALWFVTLPPYDDFMAAVKRPGVLEYRFRYSDKDRPDPFDERDQKHWYRVTGPAEKLIETTNAFTEFMAKRGGGERWALIRGGATLEQFQAEFVQLPFLHMKFEQQDDSD